MIRLFLSPENLSSEQITITGDQAKHLSVVLRVKPGDPVTIFDGQGYKYDCKVLKCKKKEVIAELISKTAYSVESPVSVTLVQGIAKGEKMDLIIQKSTELGVSRIVPVITERTQVRQTEKTERWKKIALSASQQSGRDKIPEIDEPANFEEFLYQQTRSPHPDLIHEKPESQLGIIFSEHKQERNLKKVLASFNNAKQLTLLIGPEGGFSKDEISIAVDKGFIEASLGPRILRTETAPLAALSIIQYELGDIG